MTYQDFQNKPKIGLGIKYFINNNNLLSVRRVLTRSTIYFRVFKISIIYFRNRYINLAFKNECRKNQMKTEAKIY